MTARVIGFRSGSAALGELREDSGSAPCIRIDTADGVFVYEVDTTLIVPPSRADLIEPTGRPTITLVTCWPFHWIGPAPKRFVVRGHAVPEAPAGGESSTRS